MTSHGKTVETAYKKNQTSTLHGAHSSGLSAAYSPDSGKKGPGENSLTLPNSMCRDFQNRQFFSIVF